MPDELVDRARAAAELLLRESLPRRWSHVQAVAAAAVELTADLDLPDDEAAVLVAAAWLHDIGYADPLSTTGFHPLDGARWLRTNGFGERLAGLVAYHSGAVIGAEECGLEATLRAEFADEESGVRDALWAADMSTGPDGQRMTLDERLAEIRLRYGAGHVVTRTWDRTEAPVRSVVERVEVRRARPVRRVEPAVRMPDEPGYATTT